ncbi:MAG: response regulator [Lachnospiraceae bacterium]|jgi:two-component system response regulator YesN|nr:response regulator [Lachnospiraceae bacterium]
MSETHGTSGIPLRQEGEETRKYRLMIADDEDQERMGIRFLLKRCGFAFELMEAVDGRDALEKLEHFPADILLTDVKMPFLDGIGLATEVRKRWPELPLVFFSGYDDFEYVRRALSLQAVDYILKPVDPAEFEKTMGRVMEYLQREEEEGPGSRQFQRSYLLLRLINGMPVDQSAQGTEESRFTRDYTRLILMEFETDFFGKQVADIQQFAARLGELAEGEVDFLDVSPSQGVLFLRNGYHEKSLARGLAKCIHLEVEKEYGHCCYLAVSPRIHSPEEIGPAYRAAESSLENRFFSKETYVYPEDGKQDGRTASVDTGELLRIIEKDVSCRDCYSLRRNMGTLLEECRGNGMQSYIYTRFVCANLLQVLLKGMPDQAGNLTVLVEEAMAAASFEQLEALLWKVEGDLEETLKKEQDSPKHTIALVEKYIQEHYDQVLSLDILAEKVYLTPHYLSSIFIQEKGIGINKYLKNVRMEKARQMLMETNMKISEISQRVGYSSLSYFCRSFRNEYGLTPDQYRK